MLSLKRPKSTLAQMALSSNQYALKVQRLEKIQAQTAAQKTPELPSYGNFCMVTKNPHFLKKFKGGGPREIFQKSPRKQPSFEWPKSPLAQMALSSNQYALKVQRLEKILEQTPAPNSARMAMSLRLSQGHPKPAFSEKLQRGDKGKFLKNRPKSSHRLKGLKALRHKWHYPPISMLLKCKDQKRFSCTRRLQTCPNNQVMAIFARSPKTHIF